MNTILLGVLAYVAMQLAFGIWASKKSQNEDDYLLAGRSFRMGLATFTIFATWFGAETCIGAAGAIYENGLSGGTADPFGYGACLLLMGAVFAWPLWKKKYTTFGDLFRERFSPKVEKVAVLLLIPASLFWASAQIRAFGQVLSSMSDFSVNLSITFAAAVVILYTVYGGLRAVAVTDVVQGLGLMLGLIILFVVIWQVSGGSQGMISNVEPERLNVFAREDTNVFTILEDWAIPIFGSVLTQELIARILACRSPQVARNSALMGGSLYLLIGMIPVFIGLIGPQLMPGLHEPEQLLPAVAQTYLPDVLYVFFAGALIAAILSTVDSALLSASSLMSHNVVVRMKPDMSATHKVRVAQLGVAVLGIFAYVMALYADGVYDLVETASSFGSSGIFVVGAFGLFTRFGGQLSALWALGTGIGVWLLGLYVFEWQTPYIISLASAFAAYVLTGLAERYLLTSPAMARS